MHPRSRSNALVSVLNSTMPAQCTLVYTIAPFHAKLTREPPMPDNAVRSYLAYLFTHSFATLSKLLRSPLN